MSETLLAQPAVDAGAVNDGGGENPYGSLINPDGSFQDGWVNNLQGDEFADLRDTASNYKTFPALLKGLKDSKAAAMQRLDGMVRVPGEKATDEERAAFRKAIGVPDSPEGYQIDPAAIPGGAEIDPAVFGQFAGLAHQLNLTPAQVQELAKFQIGLEANAMAGAEQSTEQFLAEQKAQLQNEWGVQWQEKFMLAQRAAQTFGLEPDNPIFRNAEVVKAFALIGASVSEDRLVSGTQVANRLSPESQADDIMSNPQNAFHAAYRNPDHPDHKAAVAEVNRLMKKAYPS